MNNSNEVNKFSDISGKTSGNNENIVPWTLPRYERRNQSIPEELRILPQWAVVKAIWNESKGKYDKLPFQANGSPAKSNDPRTWARFWNVKNSEFLGFFFNHDYTGIDFDQVIHDGAVDDWVLEIIESFRSYTEISVSGNGVHIIVKGPKPNGLGSRIKLKDGHELEIYDSVRFFLLTGNIYKHSEIVNVDLKSFFHEYIKKEYQCPELPRKIGHGIADIETVVNVLSPYWDASAGTKDKPGKLHDFMLHISGYVASSGGSENDLLYIIKELIERTGKGDFRPRIVSNAFRSSASRLKEGGKVAGKTAMKDFLEGIANESE